MALSGTINGYVSNQPSTKNPFSFYVTWSATQNIINNTSTVAVNVYWKTSNTSWTWDTVGSDRKAKVSIGNSTTGEWSQRYNCNPWPSNPYCIKSFSATVQHDSSGRASVVIKAYAYGTAAQWGPGYSYINDTTITLDTIDRTAPTVSLSTSGITASGVTLTATASTTCDRWDYSTDNGATWTNYSTTSGTSASKTLTGLTPNTTYNIKVRARKSYNQVYGSSSTSSVKTLGGSVISTVTTFTADNATAVITMSATVYNTSYKHTLTIKNGSTTVLTISNLSLVSGANNITLTSSQRTTILSAMEYIKSFEGSFELKTYDGSTQIGTESTKSAVVTTTAANSSPTFLNFTYEDINEISVAVTENNQILVQGVSFLQVYAGTATAQEGARISSYSVIAGAATASSTTRTIDVGSIEQYGTIPIIVSAIDTRGYTTSVTLNVEVIAYSKIDILRYSMRRINEVEDATQVSISGKITPVKVGNVNKNSLLYLRYRYKKTSDENYGPYEDTDVTYNDNSFSFSSDEWIELDKNYSYAIEFLVADKLTSDTVTITLSQGTPLLSFRRKMVGINNRTPSSALDVLGDIHQNGLGVIGYKGEVEDDFNDYTQNGYYTYSGEGAEHAPTSNVVGLLFVFQYDSNKVYQCYFAFSSTGGVYVRAKTTSGWNSWH